jgi:endonuclease YncB( thermonuclease family)
MATRSTRAASPIASGASTLPKLNRFALAGGLRAAWTRLQALTAGRSIVCQEKDRDRYGRIVAICLASGEDLGAIMVREGSAWAFTRFSVNYVDRQEEARAANRGVHEHDCVPAWEWRAGCSAPRPTTLVN